MTIELQTNARNRLASENWLGLLLGKLPIWLIQQRWFGAKTRAITSIEIIDWMEVSTECAIVFVQVRYAEGEPDTYQLPLRTSTANEISDATADEDFRQALLQLIEDNRAIDLQVGSTLRARQSNVFAEVRGALPLAATVSSAEQSNTSIVFADKLILKLFRRLQPGENPDVEISRFLTDVAHFPHIATFLGEITLQPRGGETTSVAMLQQFVPNTGDGWKWTLNEVARFCEAAATNSSEGVAPTYAEGASLLGRRTAEMHLALATETADAAFRSEPVASAELAADAGRFRIQIDLALDALEHAMPSLEGDAAGDAATILRSRSELLAQADAILSEQASGRIIRIHGDYHLGQVLRTNGDFIILDFEGEPARSLSERRQKRCPLKDVAGMLRSFSYAAWTGLQQHPTMLPQLQLWQDAVSSRFLNAYSETIAAQPDLLPDGTLGHSLLNAYLLEKACYELLYELNNRPAWVRIPIAGILALLAPNAATK
jgi:maltose alpha-D-glucosyltransferase / alpha-amylase